MIARLLSTARSVVYFWVLAHVEGRPDADDIVPGMVRHQGLMRAAHPREGTQERRGATDGSSGRTDTTGTPQERLARIKERLDQDIRDLPPGL